VKENAKKKAIVFKAKDFACTLKRLTEPFFYMENNDNASKTDKKL